MTLSELNKRPPDQLKADLQKCCGSTAWVQKMATAFPFPDKEKLLSNADEIWNTLSENDWKEAFTHHPKIGDINSLKEKFANTAHWAAGEQASVQKTSDEVLIELSEFNKKYEEKFGYIFIVCATGKSAEEMLALLKERLKNPPDEEIKIAAAEQLKITQLRLHKLIGS